MYYKMFNLCKQKTDAQLLDSITGLFEGRQIIKPVRRTLQSYRWSGNARVGT